MSMDLESSIFADPTFMRRIREGIVKARKLGHKYASVGIALSADPEDYEYACAVICHDDPFPYLRLSNSVQMMFHSQYQRKPQGILCIVLKAADPMDHADDIVATAFARMLGVCAGFIEDSNMHKDPSHGAYLLVALTDTLTTKEVEGVQKVTGWESRRLGSPRWLGRARSRNPAS